jgi:hypothetical protein
MTKQISATIDAELAKTIADLAEKQPQRTSFSQMVEVLLNIGVKEKTRPRKATRLSVRA